VSLLEEKFSIICTFVIIIIAKLWRAGARDKEKRDFDKFSSRLLHTNSSELSILYLDKERKKLFFLFKTFE
jgi:hypothetical protein